MTKYEVVLTTDEDDMLKIKLLDGVNAGLIFKYSNLSIKQDSVGYFMEFNIDTLNREMSKVTEQALYDSAEEILNELVVEGITREI